MFSVRRKKALIAGASLAAVALGVSAAVLVPGGEPARQGGQVAQPGVQQDARVTDAGYTVTVRAAEFSGTESLIEMQIDGPASASPNDAVTIPASAFASVSIKPIDPVGVTVPLGKPGLVRMRPLQSVGAPVLTIRAMERRDIDGATQVIEGNWEIPLKLGGTAAELLWVDELRSGPAASDNGVAVRPVRLLRSRTETLVTVQLTGPPGIGRLVLPSTRVGGERVFGARVAQDGDGLTTFSFPPTERGTPFQLDIGDLIVPADAGSDGYVDIALGDLIKERGLTGAFKEHAPVEPRYLRSTSASRLEVRSVYFAKHSADVPRSSLLNLTVAGTYDDPRGFSLVLASGESLQLAGSGSSYSTGPTGDLRQGETLLHFYFESFEALLGDVRLTFGKPSEILRGAWSVSFVP